MQLLFTGGTGFLGAALRKRLGDAGHGITCLSRSRTGSEGATTFLGLDSLKDLGPHDAVVNLAGGSVVGLWTRSKRKAIYDSRIVTTRRIADWIEASSKKPDVFLSASAVGIYGDGGSTALTEGADTAHVKGFLAKVCRDWEHAAMPAAWRGTRTVLLRTGQVLDPGGGYLAKALPIMRRFPIVVLGRKQAYFPWIALEDWISLVTHAITNEAVNGPLNLASPSPVTQEELVRVIAAKLGKRVWGGVPSWALRLAAGEFGSSMTFSVRAIPEKAIASGFEFAYSRLEPYLSSAFE